MIRDARTVAWKEWQEYLQQDRGGSFRPWRGLLLIAAGGGFIGWQLDPAFGSSLLTLPVTGAMSAMLVGTVVPDAFAGERERHTLETLLASRLSDEALVLGKFAAAASYGWVIAAAVLGAGIVAARLIHGAAEVPPPSLGVVGASLLLTLLVALLIAALGLHVSLYAPTARQAHQRYGLLLVALLMSPAIVLSMVPEGRLLDLLRWAEAFGTARLAALGTAAACLFAAALVLSAMARFRRERMIL